ncbi:MAG: D-alanyl-D-alanine carboxypeptidase [Clostridia bacterium]|nr:D-alanyl-D-alanine carboxypeptidase [Clostridia bacterium]
MGKIRIFALLTVFVLLISTFAVATPSTNIDVSAETAVMMDAKTGQVLYDKEMHKQMYPASITKIMTTILAIENLGLDDKITMSAEAVDAVSRNASHIALTEGEVITVREAVYSALLASANDACNGIAEAVSGSMGDFAKLMTDKAKEFGCEGTNFTNSNGLKDENHYTTAYDMAKITQHGLKNATWREMFGCRRYEMPPTNKQDEIRYLNNQHKMIFEKSDYYEGIVGGKTGYTTVAKNTLVTVAERDGVELIVVVMKCQQGADTYSDTKKLLDFGFENYKALKISNEDIPQKSPDGTGVKLEEPVSVLVLKDVQKVETEVSVRGNEAKLIAKLDGEEIGTFPLTITAKATAKTEEVEEEGGGIGFFGVLFIVLGSIAGLFLLIIIVLYVRKEIYLYRRRRARRLQRRNRK